MEAGLDSGWSYVDCSRVGQEDEVGPAVDDVRLEAISDGHGHPVGPPQSPEDLVGHEAEVDPFEETRLDHPHVGI